MSGAEDGVAASSGRAGGGRRPLRVFYLIAGAALAIAATGALILTDNPRLLKVAVIVAVWGCVLALLAGARTQREDELPSAREEELRYTYQLEIDREVAARREYELRLEVALRRELEHNLKRDMAELQSQIGLLRKEIAERLNGELRLERFAVRAESTRLSGGDRQALRHQVERFGLGQPDRQTIEHGTAALPQISARAAARPEQLPANPPPVAVPPAGPPLAGVAPAGAPAPPVADPLFGPLPADIPVWPEPSSQPFAGLPAGVTAISRLTPRASTADAQPGLESTRSSFSEAARTISNGVSTGYSRSAPGRRHRRAADEPNGVRPGRIDSPVAEPPSTGQSSWSPRLTDTNQQLGRDSVRPAEPRRRRRYREDDEDNDVLARMRRQH